MAFVYTVMHRESGRIYVGCTINALQRRWADHIAKAKRNPQTYFHLAIRAHGAEAFEWLAIEHYESADEVALAEEMWIAHLRRLEIPLYNVADGGRGIHKKPLSAAHRAAISRGLKGHRRSEETRAKMSTAQSGRILTEPHKERLRALRIGKSPWNAGKKCPPLSAEHRAKLAATTAAALAEGRHTAGFKKGQTAHNKGKRGAKHSAETRQKMSDAHRGKPNAGHFPKGNTPHNKKSET